MITKTVLETLQSLKKGSSIAKRSENRCNRYFLKSIEPFFDGEFALFSAILFLCVAFPIWYVLTQNHASFIYSRTVRVFIEINHRVNAGWQDYSNNHHRNCSLTRVRSNKIIVHDPQRPKVVKIISTKKHECAIFHEGGRNVFLDAIGIEVRTLDNK